MAHYAFLDENNIVTEVITGKDETETPPKGFQNWEDYYLSLKPNHNVCKRTSYNTYKNNHLDNKTPFRGNYAGIGFTYNATNDVFIPPKPFETAVLDENIWDWDYPLPYPNDNNQNGSDTSKPKKFYVWNEEAFKSDNTTGWDLSYTAVYNSSTENWEIQE